MSGYNYFQWTAVNDLLMLTHGIDREHASREQIQLAERFCDNVLGYVRSVVGH